MNGKSKKLETQAEETFDFEKEWNEMFEDIESEEDTWVRVGIDDDEETLQKEQHAGEEAGEESKHWNDPRRKTMASQ